MIPSANTITIYAQGGSVTDTPGRQIHPNCLKRGAGTRAMRGDSATHAITRGIHEASPANLA